MQTTISKWGNSLALRLPKHVAEDARLAEGTPVTIEIDGSSLKITPARKTFRLSELLEGEAERTKPGEHDWGEPRGDEAW